VTNDAPAAFPIGVTLVTWAATDAAGNTSTCIESVTVVDTTPPRIECPADVAYVASAGPTLSLSVPRPPPTTREQLRSRAMLPPSSRSARVSLRGQPRTCRGTRTHAPRPLSSSTTSHPP
jgi:hypothetical protein